MIPSQRTLQIGYVFIFPQFQRTYVLTHAVYSLLSYALASEADGGINWQRAYWFAFPHNDKSRNAAKRLGFEEEGILKSVASSANR